MIWGKIISTIAEIPVSRPDTSPLPLALAVTLALVHIFAGKLSFLGGIPRSHWLSIAGGVSVAYVFVHILPDLSEHQKSIQQAGGLGITYLEHHVYLVALLGLTVFYGLERAAKSSRQHNQNEKTKDVTSPDVFWLHIASFAVYNTLIGYLLLHRQEQTLRGLILFSFAIAVHFVVNDSGLREHHKGTYHRTGRWILAVAVLIGWLIGRATEISEAAIAVLFAFLAGGIVLNVLKEELPEEHNSRFWAFALGAGVYAAILILT